LRTILIIFTALFILSLPVTAQEKMSNSQKKDQNKTQKHGQKDEEEDPNPFPLRRVEFGLNFGAYFANKYSANFYNGSPENVNRLDFLMSNTYTYREIKTAMGLSESDVIEIPPDGYARNMHYNVAFSGGLFMRINLNRKNSFFLQANYTQLRAADVVSIKVNPTSYLTFDNIVLEPVIGKEGRVMIDLGYQRSFPLRSRINLFIQGGFTMCYTQVIKSIFVAGSTEFNLVNIYGDQGYQPGYNNQAFTVNQNAFGFGGYLGVGAGIPLTNMFGIEPGFFAHYYPTNLEGYPDFKPSFGLYLRILMFFGSTDDE
jgi:hypothetical protein